MADFRSDSSLVRVRLLLLVVAGFVLVLGAVTVLLQGGNLEERIIFSPPETTTNE